jgi:lipopolysaccharide export system protein LptA
MLLTLFFGVLIVIFALVTPRAFALDTDADQPISVLAQSAEFNPDQGLAIYTGNVEIEQGSLKVKAHKVTVYRKPDGSMDKIIAEGQSERVHMQQRPNTNDPVVHAYAMRIDYLTDAQQVDLNRQAQLENGQDRFTGERILYHLQTKRIQAWGQRAEQNADSAKKDKGQDGEGRVKIILFPNSDEAP